MAGEGWGLTWWLGECKLKREGDWWRVFLEQVTRQKEGGDLEGLGGDLERLGGDLEG